MKKFLFLLFITANVFALRIEGMVNYGPFLNCEIYNDYHVPVQVKNYEYTIRLRNGQLYRENLICQFNCTIEDYGFKRFSGPVNSPMVYDARCSANVARLVRPPRRR
ncbi:hypothetical protein [Bacteriovorax sp. Seq25_V]|uniref:hypothetical protein n=1 Tax=Bacteriovorax sp. Seq25_V TaxID=1201288 RepID=UPI00038A2900|nr:hypothetical protein [Bacteriovorax sp. Seq25_V]EQC45362.1 hypothetical protein M900_2140 [Bacteriovorax sp. Seq25_V]